MTDGVAILGGHSQVTRREALQVGDRSVEVQVDGFQKIGGNDPAMANQQALAVAARTAGGGVAKSFESFDADTQTSLKETARQLSRQGQLFVQPAAGSALQKCNAVSLYGSLEEGQGLVYLVERGQEHESGSTSSSSSQAFGSQGYGGSSTQWNHMRDSSGDKGLSTADFSAVPILSWKDVEWAETSGHGFGSEVQSLPAPVGTAQTARWHAVRSSGSDMDSSGDITFGSSTRTSSFRSEEWAN